MLANGAKLEYKKKGDGDTYTNLLGLKEIPDTGVEAEKVENTDLMDKHKKYEQGVGDLPDMVYKFKYNNTDAKSPYRLMREAQISGEVLSFRETLKDGTATEYDAQVSVKRTGGGVNGVIDFEITMLVQSDLVFVDPA